MKNPKRLLSAFGLSFLLAGCGASVSGEADSTGSALSAPGLQGSYFPSIDLTGTPVKRVDSTLAFNWGAGSPVTGIGVDRFSVRWTGFVTARYGESYTFTTTSDDGVRVTVNGKQVINAWNDHGARDDSGTITLVAGKAVPITVEFYENGGDAALKLAWASAHQAKEVIPSSQLSSGNGSGNLLTNPSFEQGTSGWIAWQGVLTRVASSLAADGAYVARVAPAPGMTACSLDDAPDSARSTGGSYAAAVSVAAASTSAVGKTVTLILREKTSGGTVQLWSNAVALKSTMQRLSVTGTSTTSGNIVDVYVYQEGAAASDAFYADALSLTLVGGGATPAPVPTPTPSPSGVAMPTGNLASNGITWKPIFSDDFKTDAALGSFLTRYAANWGAYGPGWSDTSKNGTYDPARTLSVSGGMLDLWVHTENGVHCVAAPTPNIAGQTYGRYAVRFKADSVAGYKTAWLLWPDSGKWPNDGEIDFPEGGLNGEINAYAHHASASGGQDAFEHLAPYGGSGWHTAVTEWSAGKLVFMLDGKVVGTSTRDVPHNPMHYVMQTETNLTSTPPSSAAQGHVDIDWVVIYQPT